VRNIGRAQGQPSNPESGASYININKKQKRDISGLLPDAALAVAGGGYVCAGMYVWRVAMYASACTYMLQPRRASSDRCQAGCQGTRFGLVHDLQLNDNRACSK
jgi:hypothetical protein